jgi:tripartite-type tricarboxylate transporter receptor subunit TctC
MRLLVIALAMTWLAPLAAAGNPAYPERPIRLIVGQAPGGATDIVVRAFAKRLSDELGQPIVIDNRAGAGGIIGAALVASAAPDGYTLLAGTNGPIAISPHVTPGLQYDSHKDFAPVTLFSEVPFVLMVHPSVKAATVQELIALAKSQPGKLHFGSSGQAGTPHLCGELSRELSSRASLSWPAFECWSGSPREECSWPPSPGMMGAARSSVVRTSSFLGVNLRSP